MRLPSSIPLVKVAAEFLRKLDILFADDQVLMSNTESIILNMMFHAPMGRFQLEKFIIFPIFALSSHPTVVYFLRLGLSLLILLNIMFLHRWEDFSWN